MNAGDAFEYGTPVAWLDEHGWRKSGTYEHRSPVYVYHHIVRMPNGRIELVHQNRTMQEVAS